MKNEKETQERKLLFCEKRSSRWLDFEYRLYSDGYEKAPFSIEVLATNQNNVKKAELIHCFDSEEYAKAFFDIAVRNLATPHSLQYMYENFCE